MCGLWFRHVLKHLLGKSVNLIPCFTRERASYASDEFQLAVDPLLHPVVFEPDDVIFEQRALLFVKGREVLLTHIDNRFMFLSLSCYLIPFF